MADRVSSALACVYLARAASTLACCAAAESLRSSGSSRIRGWPFWTRCPTSTDRSRIFPATRKPKSLCTRASTIPVKVLPFEPAAFALKTSTLGDCRRGSFIAGLEHPPAIRASVSHPASISRPIPEETPVTNLILLFSDVCIYTILKLVYRVESIPGLFVQGQRGSFEIRKNGGPPFFTESFNRGALSGPPSRREFLHLFSAFRRNCQFDKPSAPAAAHPHQTVPLHWPEIAHECRALHSQPITQFRHVPTVLGFQ